MGVVAEKNWATICYHYFLPFESGTWVKKHTCLTNRQIGEQFGNISYSAVAKAYWRFSERLKKDKMLRKKITEIMSYVKG